MPGSCCGNGAVRITLFGLTLNLGLTAIKVGVGAVTGSMALVADGVHSLTDVVTDLAVLGGLRISQRPADSSHAYGHGKFETVATALVALALLGAGGWIAGKATVDLLQGVISPPGPVVAGVAALSVISKEWLFQATRKVARKLRSRSLEANAWHHRSDALSSVAVLVGGIAAAMGFVHGDQAAAMAVAVLIAWAAVGILRGALYELTEGALPLADQTRVTEAIASVAGVRSWHKLRTRSSGREAFVDVHIQVDPAMSVVESHTIASQVEEAIRQALSQGASIVVHVEPEEGTNEATPPA